MVICPVTLSYILLEILNVLDSIFYQKFINAYMTYWIDQFFQTAALTLRIYLHFWTTTCNHLLRGLNIIIKDTNHFLNKIRKIGKLLEG